MKDERQTITIREGSFRDKEQLLRYLAGQLDFPDYFGMNYDALCDCLGDLSHPVTIEFISEEEGETRDTVEAGSEAMQTVLTIAKDVAEWNENLKVVRRGFESLLDADESTAQAAAILLEQGAEDENGDL